MKKVVALDFGSNTFLALGVEGTDHGISRIHFDLTDTVRLGEKVSATGRLQASALQRAEDCLKKFKVHIDQFKPDEIKAVATAAARRAENQQELFDLAAKYGIPIDIIEGEREARISFAGAVDRQLIQGENFALIDIGGGSTEVIVSQKNQITFAKSFPIGGVNMTEKFFSEGTSKAEGSLAFQNFLQPFLDQIPKFTSPIESLIAVAGTPTSLAAAELGGFDEKRVHGYRLTEARLEEWVHQLKPLTSDQINQRFGMGSRSDIIFAGTLILKNFQKRFHSDVVVSTRGVRYGLALEMLHAI